MEYITDAHQAEVNASRLMQSWGFHDAKTAGSGPDGGVDVRARKALAQVKWKAGVTGRPDLQRLVGARGTGAQQLIFFSASGYSAQAIEYADQVGVALFTYDPTGAPTAMNPAARVVSAGSAGSGSLMNGDVKFFVVLLAVLLPAFFLLIYLS